MNDLTLADCIGLADSWILQLTAERKSPETLKSYAAGLRGYLAWCAEQEVEPLVKANLQGWTLSLLGRGQTPSTVTARMLAVRRFTAWLFDEGEIADDPFPKMKPPKIDEEVIEPLSEDELRAMLRACQVPRGTAPKVAFRRRRDEAIIRLMSETGGRASEVTYLGLADVDLLGGTAIIRRGKGGKGRPVPFGPDTARALDRYIRLRRTHRLAGTDRLWLGDRGKGFTYDALYKTLQLRATEAGVEGFHPHRLRHTMAHRWLEAGGSEGGLMAVAGWSTSDMLRRYTKAQAHERAAVEAKRLRLGEL